MNRTSYVSGIRRRSLKSCSASSMILVKLAPRCDISITLRPFPSKFIRSNWHLCRTSSYTMAGPAEKFARRPLESTPELPLVSPLLGSLRAGVPTGP